MNHPHSKSPLRYPFAQAPAPGTLQDVAPGVSWLRMPMPGALNHINLWVLHDNDGVTLVDTGLANDETKALWTQIFAGPLAGKRVKRVLCTHHHPDHMSLAGWLVETLQVPFWSTAGEWQRAQVYRKEGRVGVTDAITAHYRRAGLSDEFDRAAFGNRPELPMPKDAILIDPTQPIEAAGVSWQVIVGRGHSPELAALYAPTLKVLISGDQVLPVITPNVSVHMDEPDADPLRLFLESMGPLRTLSADTLVLPSHQMPFYGLHDRLDQMREHHEERLQFARDACKAGVTAAQALPRMFSRRLNGQQIYFALGETLAHLNYLVFAGDMTREATDGVDIYRTR